MVAPKVVAVRHDQDAPGSVDPPPCEREEVEGCGIGPLHVVEDGERRRTVLSTRSEELGEQVMAVVAVRELGEAATGRTGDVEHRPERPRCLQGVALAPELSRHRSPPSAELLHERCLADSGLA